MNVIRMWPTPPEGMDVISPDGKLYLVNVELTEIDNLVMAIDSIVVHEGGAPEHLRLELTPEKVRELQALLQGAINRQGGGS